VICDIDLIIDKAYKPKSEFVNKNFKVIDYRNFENNYDNILYHMGNNPFHEYLYEIAIRNPGIVVLHDPFLHHLVRHMTVGNKNNERYIKIMEYCLGAKGRTIAENALVTKQFPLFDYPLIKELVDSSSAIIVHSDFAEKTVKDESPDALIKKIKMPITIPEKTNEKDLREKLKIPEDYIVIGTFGNVGFYKRLNVCLKSFSHYHKKNPKSIFLIAGKYLNEKYEDEINDLIDQLGISDSVIETGYVDDLFSHIEISDIITQLRYPTAGETSIISLQIMGMEKPVIVSNIGSFSELPDDTVIKIEPDVSEEVSLYNAFLKLTNDSAFRAVLASNAKQYIKNEHDPEKIATQFFDFISNVPKKEPLQLIIKEKPNDSKTTLNETRSVSGKDGKKPSIIENTEKADYEKSDERTVEELQKIKVHVPLSEEDANVSHLELKNIKSGKRILKGIRSALHKEINDWIVYPFQKKQSKFNIKTVKNILKIYDEINGLQTNLIHMMKKNEGQIKEELMSQIEKSDIELDQKIEKTIRFNLARRIDSLIEEKFISLRETFEIENKIKQTFLDILKRNPTEDELRKYVNKIKKNKITFSDLEKELNKNTN